MQAQLAQMGAHLDVRVYRRVARELWNAAAGVRMLALISTVTKLGNRDRLAFDNIMMTQKLQYVSHAAALYVGV